MIPWKELLGFTGFCLQIMLVATIVGICVGSLIYAALKLLGVV